MQRGVSGRLRSVVRLAWMALAVLVGRSVLFTPMLVGQERAIQEAQPSLPGLPSLRATAPLERVLQWLVLRSPVIFLGEVLADEPASRSISSSASIHVTDIRVDRAVRGARSGEFFSLRQWDGAEGLILAPHQRVILFLHQPNAAGVTSSAAGGFGLFTLGGGDRVDLRSLAVLARQIAPHSARVSRMAVSATSGDARPAVAGAVPGALPATRPKTMPETMPESMPAQQLMGLLEELAPVQRPWWDRRTPAEAANAP